MIKRYIFIAGCACVVVFVIIIFARLYPVAIVNGSLIWYRTWDRYIKGNIHALAVQAQTAGIEFNPNTDVLSVIKKDALRALIENVILAHAGSILIPRFDFISNQKIRDAIATSTDIEKAALFIYGFNTADFRDFVLLPQSHREVIQNQFDKQKINFAAWLAGVKKKARVRLMIHPYTWDSDTIK